MVKAQVRTLELMGTHYEIGGRLGRMVEKVPGMRKQFAAGFAGFGKADVKEAVQVMGRWCPGLNEELEGFAAALGIEPIQVTYYAMTYLRPGCSQMVLMPDIAPDKHITLVRNYEFSNEAEEFTLVKTSAKGKYTHLGTAVMQFGRDEGLNECGLAVSMSSCGFPVGAMPGMRKPALRGLQFWAVIRAVLENCKNVAEALAFIKDMPIAYNLNLLLADKGGNAALVETMNGSRAVKQINTESPEHYLHATNHIHLPELVKLEPKAMRNSLHRYDTMQRYLNQEEGITRDGLKQLLLRRYPEGLCCYYYPDFFGTTKSMIMDPVDGTIEVCWGGKGENGWQRYAISSPLQTTEKTIELTMERGGPTLFEFVALR